MKRFPLFSLASLVLSGLIFLPPAFSQTNETLTISTYYPSPYGVYKELRLYPNINPTPCDDSTEGNMYYDDDKNEVMVCRGLLGGWQSMGLWTLDGTSLYPTNTTWNVGIGTTIPAEKLHVAGSVIAEGAIFKSGNIAAVNNALSVWTPNGGFIAGFSDGSAVGMGMNTVGHIGFGANGPGALPYFALYREPTDDLVHLQTYPGGRNLVLGEGYNVGIGTTSPGTNKLDVAGTAQLRGAVGGTGLYVNPSGNVGIGITSPGTSLHIVGSPTVVSDRTLVVLDGGGSRDAAMTFSAVGSDGQVANGIIESSSVGGHSGWTAEPEGLFLWAFKNNDMSQSSRMRIIGNPITLENGNVGIGTGAWNPGWLLHVSGDAAKPGGGSWTDSSDIRLKKNVAPLTGALEKVLQLRGVTFEWTEPEHAKLLPGTQIGMIGQEVEKVFPSWVGTDASGYKDLTIRGFEALSVEAMRELKTKNDTLKARVDELEKRIKLSEAR